MQIFMKDKKISSIMNKLDIAENGKKVFGIFISVREPKNKAEFKRLAKHLFRVSEDDNYEPTVAISTKYCCFKDKTILFYSIGKYYLDKDELKGKREEICIK